LSYQHVCGGTVPTLFLSEEYSSVEETMSMARPSEDMGLLLATDMDMDKI
jgi:hypothetical protein